MITVDLISVIHEPLPSTRILVNFNDGTQREFSSVEELRAFAAEAESDIGMWQRVLISVGLAKDPQFTNISVIQKRLTLDTTAVDPVKIGNVPNQGTEPASGQLR